MWLRVWKTLGTPLSDATEERTWRKMLHRALNVRNRHPGADHACRNAHCRQIESQLHLIRCVYITPFWTAIMDFIRIVLSLDIRRFSPERALIFGLRDASGEFLPPTVRAVIRHAWGHMYRHFTMVETDSKMFNANVALLHTLTSFRDAALRHCMIIRHAEARVKYSKRPVRMPKASDVKSLIATTEDDDGNVSLQLDKTGCPTLHPAFASAIIRAQHAART